MAKVKYYYDTKTLSYKRITLSKATKAKNVLYYLIASAFTGLFLENDKTSKEFINLVSKNNK